MDPEIDDALLEGGGDDLRAALASALAGDGGGSAPEADHSETPADAGAAAAPAKPAVERNRTPDGRFAEKPGEQPAPGAPEQPQAPAATPPETPAQPAAATRAAPQSWSAETKQAWGSLPPAIQDQVLKREDETNRVLQDSANARKFTSTMEQIVTPHAPLLQREGVNLPQAVANLLSFHDLFDRDPMGCIAHLQQLAAQRGQRPAAPPQGGAQPQTPAAPPRQAPQPVDVQGIVDARLAHHQQQQVLASEIATFKANAPHFDRLSPQMAALIRNGQATDLRDAYDKASWLDPDVRASLIAAQVAPAAAPQGAPQAAAQVLGAADPARVAKARNAAGSVRGAPGGTTAKPAERSLREELEAQFAGP